MAKNPRDMVAVYKARQVVKKDIEELKKIVEKDIALNYHLLWLLALRDEFGFGYSRLLRVYNKVCADAEAISEGYLNFEDIKETLESEVKGLMLR